MRAHARNCAVFVLGLGTATVIGGAATRAETPETAVPAAKATYAVTPSGDPETSYTEHRTRLDAQRKDLAARLQSARTGTARAAVLGSARALAFASITSDLLPAWYGTPWEFHGTSETPGEGTIACGYLVSTVLRDAGFRVPRIRLAQQASEYIVRSLAPPSRILRFRNRPAEDVVGGVWKSQGAGLYVVGMDYHVGFLVLEGTPGEARPARADLCHSAFVSPAEVACEPAAQAVGFVSNYHVVGPALDDARVEDWLLERAIPIRRGG